MADQAFKIVGIAGSLRRASWNRGLLRAAVEGRPDGIEIVTLDLDLVPPYNQDIEDEGDPSSVIALKDVIGLADALLIATPEYNNGMPGVLKNAIDWVSRPYGDNAWQGKPVAVMGASIGMLGSARAQYHLRQSFVFLNMYPVNQPEVLIASAAQRFNERGELTDETSRELIRKLLAELMAWTKRLKG